MIDRIVAFLDVSAGQAPPSIGVLVLILFAAGFVPLPRIIVCVLAGAAYGFVAIPVSIPSFTFGALGGFVTARYLFHDLVQGLIGRRKLLSSISDAVDQEGWRVVALMRLGAPVPGAMTNYAFGLSNVGWWSFTWATFVFCIPQIILFVSLGAAGRAAVLDDKMSIAGQAMMVIAIATCALIVYRVARRARARFNELRQNDAAATTDAQPTRVEL
ncbi:VTT domain-containing protein [Bradyrhizobium sp. LHD-71]|uniref:TVP38/TMEM64 family protein n=1 Tax=Bradyrhizobium sp. LHD-71 TaxID=3072141 RepID=UPI00280EA34C|nr:VTT domain-containing protein [Bradyrhizobium sp. LHD-71]MDQ8732061.1 VTT domain-containing protein [Bradyrhizobium sp. LHD-71]